MTIHRSVPYATTTFAAGVALVILTACGAHDPPSRASRSVQPRASQLTSSKQQANTLIAFAAERAEPPTAIYAVAPDGAAPTKLARDSSLLEDPAWSPDGTRLAVASTRNGNFDIYVVRPGKPEWTRLTTSPAEDLRPTWSPDGREITFWSLRDRKPDVFVENVASKVTRRLTRVDQNYDPAWSPTGSEIAYWSTRGPGLNADIYVIDAAGGVPHRLTDDPADDVDPAWSPDGKHIAFTSTRNGEGQIYVMDPNGTNVRRITHDNADDGRPAWSPDGSQITFQRRGKSGFDLYVVDASGGEERAMITGLDAHSPSWQRRPG